MDDGYGGIRRALTIHQQERDSWLAEMCTLLERDQRVDAAWLFGSLGRGNADELSDIDLFISVSDDQFDDMTRQRYAFMAQIVQPLLILEAPQNWPPGGVYNMALYPGTHGPHQVDWYWVRHSSAQIPTETRVLFDHSGLPQLDRPAKFDYAPVPERSPEEIATQTVNMFWVMWFITAKYIARKPEQSQEELFKWVNIHLGNVAAFVDGTSSVSVEETSDISSAERVQHLRQLAAAMKMLMPRATAKGASVPVQIEPYADRYLALVEAVSLDRDRIMHIAFAK